MHAVAFPAIMAASLVLGGCGREEVHKVPSGGIYLSKSAGASFEQSVNLTQGGTIDSFDLGAIHRSPANANIVFLAAGSNGMVISRDDGQAWQAVPTTMAATVDVAMFPNNVMIASGYDEARRGVVKQSVDGGVSWHTVFTIPQEERKQRFQFIRGGAAVPIGITSLAVNPKQEGQLYAGTNDGTLFIAEQYGKVWRKAAEIGDTSEIVTGSRAGAGIIRIIIPIGDFADLMMLTEDKRLMLMKGGEIRELKVPESLDAPSVFGVVLDERKILDAATIPGFPDALLIGTETGAVLTRDAGETFIELNVPLDSTREIARMVVSVSPSNTDRVFIVADGVVYRSEDSGQTWHTTSVGPAGFTVTDLSINPANASRVLAILKALAT